MYNPDLTGREFQEKKSNNEEKMFEIKVTDHDPFPNIIEGGVMTLYEVMEKVSELFGSAFKDYAGCFVQPYPQGNGFNVQLYFTLNPTNNDGTTYAFTRAGEAKSNNKSSIVNSYNRFSARVKPKLYEITDEGSNGLAKFFPANLKIRNRDGSLGHPDYKRYVTEIARTQAYGSEIYALVTGLDLYRIISEIYGNKDGDGDHYQYEIVPKKPLNQNPGAAPNSLDWLVYIQRIKMKSLEAIGKKVGLITFNEIPMIGRKC